MTICPIKLSTRLQCAPRLAGQGISHTQGNPRVTSRGDIHASALSKGERLADGKAGRGGHAERIT
jgi:hypothetical protein